MPPRLPPRLVDAASRDMRRAKETTKDTLTASVETTALATFQLSLAGLNPRVGVERETFAVEQLSPLLADFEADEFLSIELSGGGGLPLLAGIAGHIRNHTDSAGDRRLDVIQRLLELLSRVQLPGFRFRRDQGPRAFRHERRLIPAGRPLSIEAASAVAPAPRAVKASRLTSKTESTDDTDSDTLRLPPLVIAPRRLIAVARMLSEARTHTGLSIRLRLVQLDAKLQRRFAKARVATEQHEPASHFEAMRHVADAMPDHQYLSAMIDDRQAIEVTVVARADAPISDTTARILCHALFSSPLDEAPALETSDPIALYPRAFILPNLLAGLAMAAAYSFQRPPQFYRASNDPGVLLGATQEGQAVVLADRDRALHTFSIGATGTGKSTLLLNQLKSDMDAGKGLILVDPHGDLWEKAHALVPPTRRRDVVSGHLGDPKRTFTMNVLASLGGDPATERNATVNALLRLFTRTLWPGVPEAFGPVFELYYRNAMLLMMEGEGDKATFLMLDRVFQDSKYRKSLLATCQTESVLNFWNKTVPEISYNDWSLGNMTPYITSKFTPFTSNALLTPVLGSPTSSLDLTAAIDSQKIVLINLAKGTVGDGSARLVGSMLTMRLVAAAQRQMVLPEAERKPFVAYLDEFQTYATEHIAEGIEETRKYKLSLVLACQSLGQIDGSARRSDVGRSIIANVANLIAFRLGVEDAEILAKWFQPDVTADDLMYLPNYTAVARLLVSGQALRPVEFRTVAPPDV
jgi:hypothetical protein